VADRVRHGIAYVPEDRRRHGVVLEMPVSQNVTLAALDNLSRFGALDFRRERELAADYTKRLGVKTASIRSLVSTLSGGNQQKVVLARWLTGKVDVLLLDEPTRGVDVGARSEIYQLIRSLADRGVAVVVVSSEIEEVLGLADRVHVVREGEVVHESAATDIDEAKVLDLVMEGKAVTP